MQFAKFNLRVILWIAAIHSAAFAQPAIDSLLGTLPNTCRMFMQQRWWPSLSVAVVVDQRTVFSQAFGYADIDRKIPATTRTIYRVGSITKLFTATMLLQLAEQGKVCVDDPLVKYLPSYTPKYPANAGPTTLRQLATHTAGLHVDAAQGFWHYLSNLQWIVSRGKEPIVWGVTKDDIVSSLDKVEIEYTPGTSPHYSNLGYQLLGIALEQVAHEPFERYVKSRILDPLRMEDSDFSLDNDKLRRFASGYTYLEPDFQRFNAPEWDLAVLKYSGGLFSTAEDIARFISFQFRDQIEDEGAVLTGDGLRFMRTPQTLRSSQSNDVYGIGWATYDYEGHQVMGHAGGHWGFFAKAEVLPDLKLGVVFMTNCSYPQGNLGPEKDLTRIIFDRLIPVLEKKAKETDAGPRTSDLSVYAGHYALSGEYAHAEIYVRNDTLFFSLAEKPQFREAILPAGYQQFCFAADPGKHPLIRFDTDNTGGILGLEFLGFTFRKR